MPRGKSFSHILVLFNIVAFLAGGLQHFAKSISERHYFEFESLYLGVVPSENVSSSDIYLFQILSAASRKAITRKWLKLEKSTVDKWFDIIYNIF